MPVADLSALYNLGFPSVGSGSWSTSSAIASGSWAADSAVATYASGSAVASGSASNVVSGSAINSFTTSASAVGSYSTSGSALASNLASGSAITSGSALASASNLASGSAITSGSAVHSGSALASASNLASGSAISSGSALASASNLASGSAITSGSALASASNLASGSAITSGSAVAGSVYIPGSRPIPLIPVEQHVLNVDPNPVLIRKKPAERLQYIQNVSLKFLKPPLPAQPGEITILQEKDVQSPPAPPLHITQKPALPLVPAPIVVRERPPKPPAPVAPRHITIPGKVIPPPPRKVIVERLPQIPPKPADIIVERWLGYQRRTRQVNFVPAPALIPIPAPKNVLIQWDSPDVDVKQAFHFLGVQVQCPVAYLNTHPNLADASQLPAEVAQFATPLGETLAVNSNSDMIPALTGSVASLRLINLACNGLAEYAPQL